MLPLASGQVKGWGGEKQSAAVLVDSVAVSVFVVILVGFDKY